MPPSNRFFPAELILGIVSFACSESGQSTNDVRIFAAASARHAIKQALSERYITGVKLNAAASSLLARQIESGAPADIFVSADIEWMEWLKARNLTEDSSIQPLFANQLVVVSKDATQTWPPSNQEELRVALGDPEHVPAGRYAKHILKSQGLWTKIEKTLITTRDVRSALAMAERAEVDFALVYKTDAQSSDHVHVIKVFPLDHTLPIIYPIAIIKKRDRPQVDRIYQMLLEQQNIYQAFGFRAAP